MKFKFAVVAACCFAGSVFAADMSGGMGNGIQGVFIGVNAGQAFYTFDNSAFTAHPKATFVQKKNRLAYGVNVGYWVDPNWGVAVGYDVLGKPQETLDDATKDATGKITDGVHALYTNSVTDVNVSLLGQTSVYPNLNVFGRLGLAYVMSEQKQTGYQIKAGVQQPSVTVTQKDKKLTAIIGLGASYAVTNNVYLTAEYNFIPSAFKKYDNDPTKQTAPFKRNIHVVRAGLQFMF